MRRERLERLRAELGYFENYVEPSERPCGFSARALLAIVGLAALIAAGASAYGWLFN